MALALAVMELSLSVSSGFKHEIERKVMGFDAAVTVMPPYDYSQGTTLAEMHPDRALSDVVMETLPNVRAVETFRRPAVLKTDSDFMAVQCVAYGEGHDNAFEKSNLIRGSLPGLADSIVVSETMARRLGIDTADRVFLYFFVDGAPKARRVHVSGVYNSNFSDYDNSVIYTAMSLLQGLGTESDVFTGLQIEGISSTDRNAIAATSERLQSALIDAYQKGQIAYVHPVTNMTERNPVIFSWLGLLDTNVVVVFIIMLFVAGFTLISSLFIIVLDNIPTIGILRSLGSSRPTISRIFINIALRLTLSGMIIGNILALGIMILQNTTHFLPLNPEMYYLDSVPLEISWPSVLLLNLGVFIGAWLILIVPARIASRIDPASTVRYE